MVSLPLKDVEMKLLTYKGFEATAAYDEDAEIFHGEVINVRDVITFQSKTIKDLFKVFVESVEDYLSFRGEQLSRG